MFMTEISEKYMARFQIPQGCITENSNSDAKNFCEGETKKCSPSTWQEKVVRIAKLPNLLQRVFTPTKQ